MYKKDIYNVEQINDKVTFLYQGDYVNAAKLRNFMKNNIYSYLIHKVTFYQNDSHASNESLAATRFGLLVLQDDVTDLSTGNLHVIGPKMVMASDIEGLTFVHNAPIVYLRAGEILKCEFSVSYECGERHQKWCPVAATTFYAVHDGYEFCFELVGMLSLEEIMDQIP